jgi:spoIIIJ-associated protein
MQDLVQAAEQVAAFMRVLTTTGGLRLKFRITAGAGAADPDGFERRDIYVECKGLDADLLVEHDGELLRSLEHVAAKILRLEPEEHDRVSFDTEGYKARRAAALRSAAAMAIANVRETGEPYQFISMSSRERRMLHMFLRDTELQTASSGEGVCGAVSRGIPDTGRACGPPRCRPPRPGFRSRQVYGTWPPVDAKPAR